MHMNNLHGRMDIVSNVFKLCLLLLQTFRVIQGHTEVHSGNSGSLASSGWPGAGGGLNCRYTVTGTLPLVVTFDTIRLTTSSDILKVLNHCEAVLWDFSGVGTYHDRTLYTDSNRFIVVFHTTDLAANEGWTLSWTYSTGTTRSKSFSGDSGSLASLDYPCDYPNSGTCTYTIDAGNTIVSLAFESFESELDGYILKVYNNSVTLVETMSGQLGAFAVFPSKYYKLEFTANSATTGQGFSASWQASRLASVSRSAYGACLNVGFDRVASTELSVQPFEKNRDVDRISCSTMCASMSQCVAFVAEQDTCVWFKTGLATSSTDFVYKKR